MAVPTDSVPKTQATEISSLAANQDVNIWGASGEFLYISKDNLKTTLGVDAVEAKNATQDGRLADVENKNTTQDGRLDNLESTEAMMKRRGFILTRNNPSPSAAHPSMLDTDIIWFDGVVGKLQIMQRVAKNGGKDWAYNGYATHPGAGKKLKMYDGSSDTVMPI